jgi:hypothetical protein
MFCPDIEEILNIGGRVTGATFGYITTGSGQRLTPSVVHIKHEVLRKPLLKRSLPGVVDVAWGCHSTPPDLNLGFGRNLSLHRLVVNWIHQEFDAPGSDKPVS